MMRNHRILYAAVLIAALLMGCAPQEDAEPTDQPTQAASGQPSAEFPLDENGCPDPGVNRVNGLLYPVGLTEHESAPQETVDIRLLNEKTVESICLLVKKASWRIQK